MRRCTLHGGVSLGAHRLQHTRQGDRKPGQARLEPEEVAAAVPDSNKTLTIESFIPCSDIDTVYFDKPYYLTPDKMGTEAYVLLREGMKKAKVAAIAHTVLFRRMRTVLIRPHGKGLIASTLNFDYEVRSSQEAFEDQPDIKSDPELLEIAELIIDKKKGTFDASTFDDRYEDAVTELVKAKIEGRSLPKKKAAPAAKAVDLLQALRESAGLGPLPTPMPAQAVQEPRTLPARQRPPRHPAAAQVKRRPTWLFAPIGKAT